MMSLEPALRQWWVGTAIHLEQTTLVLLGLLLLGCLLRNAPARMLDRLWWLGLVKLLLPLPLLGAVSAHLLKLGSWGTPAADGTSALVTVWVARTTTLLDPFGVSALRSAGGPPSSVGPFTILTLLWALGAAWFGLRWVRQRRAYRPAGGVAAHAAAPGVHDRLVAALRGTRIPPSAIRVVSGSRVPIVAGLWRPRILLPVCVVAGLSRDQLRAVLLHEDAHRRRRDPLRGAVRRLVTVVFFFYPPLWPLLARMRATEEMACDEVALAKGIRPHSYARALARVITLGLAGADLSAIHADLPALVGHPGASLFRRRLDHLFASERRVAMHSHRIVLLLAALLILVTSLAPVPRSAAIAPDVEDFQQPVPVTIVHPGYPLDGLKNEISGDVLLSVLVLKDGRVGAVGVEAGIPEYPSFADSSVAAVSQWTFEPARRDGEVVETTIRIPIRFALDDEK